MKNINNKKIGIIGGVGPQATQKIYGDIIKFAQQKYGAKNNDDFPSIVIESVPVPDFISNTSRIEEAEEMFNLSIEALESAGATVLGIGSNTVHILLDDFKKLTKVPFISMLSLTAKECAKRGYNKVGVLGSPVTKKYGMYKDELEKFGISAIYPDESEQEIVDQIIRHVLAGTDNGEIREQYIGILNDLIASGTDGLILGCTELPQAINYDIFGTRIINSDEILSEALVDYYYYS